MKTMNYKGFKAQIMKAPRLIGEGEHNLPSGSAIDIFPVDAFENPLTNWLSGPGNYVVPVDSDWGLWFNWTYNDESNTAVLLSIKGMNPITGQRSNGFTLERYEEKCPVHNENFKDGLFCEKCNFKWPKQNYVSYPNKLWWDGFRTADGKVRQFFFTEDLSKSIPELVIGKEDTIPAFGFAFFKPKIRRETQAKMFKGSIISPNMIQFGPNTIYMNSIDYHDCTGNAPLTCCETKTSSNVFNNALKKRSISKDFLHLFQPEFESDTCNLPLDSVDFKLQKKTTEVGVGAGAIIKQDLDVDPLKITDWEEQPSSVMRLYFIFEDQFEEIQSKGMKDLIGEAEGYLSNLPVG